VWAGGQCARLIRVTHHNSLDVSHCNARHLLQYGHAAVFPLVATHASGESEQRSPGAVCVAGVGVVGVHAVCRVVCVCVPGVIVHASPQLIAHVNSYGGHARQLHQADQGVAVVLVP
jgi:hypothetical protein